MILHLLDLNSIPIFDQLQIEEALLRGTEQNFCVINRGSPRAIVMGISGKPEELLNIPDIQRDSIPIIKRFSGGGTVIVDQDTLFITFIFNKQTLPIQPFPEPILRWSAELYAESWKIPDFHLIENDYAIGPKKCGGNAQYIQKNRFLHHTSFLWDYQNENMAYLKLPAKRPAYRESRTHEDFLCRMKDSLKTQETLIDLLKLELDKRFEVLPFHRDKLTWEPHRQSVEWICAK